MVGFALFYFEVVDFDGRGRSSNCSFDDDVKSMKLSVES